MKESKLFFFDFDGVIIDSTEECFQTSYKTAYFFFDKIKKPFPKKNSKTYESFALIRPFVAGAEQYLGCWHSILHRIKVKSANDITLLTKLYPLEERKLFTINFYKNREIMYKENPSNWMRLHKDFKWLTLVLIKLAAENRLKILTFKDYDSVYKISEWLGISGLKTNIITKDGSNSKADQINEYIIKNKINKKNVVFVDDNITHLIPAQKFGFLTKYPTWSKISKTDIELARQNKIESISPLALIELCGYQNYMFIDNFDK